ncbi:hypothetical protein Syun_019713 [Stephania yunnanensis]|uniref:Uncharacterized protein n=1 Tax=Stephania yunnanensis TaxID=152371 RepID=A0AAP0NZN7_9MAGN
MLAIVCKSNESIKHLEPYYQKGKINNSIGLHGALSLDGGMIKRTGFFSLGSSFR